MVNYFFVNKILNENIPYSERACITKISIQLKGIHISATPTEHIDIVSKPHIPFCSGNLKKKLNLRLYNGVAFNTLLPYTLTKHSSE